MTWLILVEPLNYTSNFTGNSTIQCLESGEWSAPQPTCNEIFCDVLDNPDHGVIEYFSGTNVNITNGTVAKVTCENGFYYNLTEFEIECFYGNWSDRVGECLPDNCTVPALDNGSFNINQTSYTNGTVLAATCNHNFVLAGNVIFDLIFHWPLSSW